MLYSRVSGNIYHISNIFIVICPSKINRNINFILNVITVLFQINTSNESIDDYPVASGRNDSS